MSFNGYLLKFGSDTFDLKYIFKDSYSVTPDRRQDLDPYRDANGKLHRNVVSHYATTITFQTKPMWNSELDAMMSFIRSHFENSAEKKLDITYFNPLTNGYSRGDFYMPDIAFPIHMIDGNRILYSSVQLEFIEY